jgi:hypothetical protein
MNGGDPDSDIRHSVFGMLRSSFRARPWIRLAVLASLGALLSGCPVKEPRYPADHARFQKIDAAVEKLRKAYAEKDPSAFEALLLPSDRIDRIANEVKKDFKAFQEITLEVSIERIVIDEDTIDVFVHWQGEWKRTAADTGLRERGHGMLRWAGVQSILLRSVEGDLPFGMATRRPEPDSQKSGTP